VHYRLRHAAAMTWHSSSRGSLYPARKLCFLRPCAEHGSHARLQVLALGDMGASVGDLQAFRDTAEDEPFAHDLPPFPVERRKAAAPSFRQRGEVRTRLPVYDGVDSIDISFESWHRSSSPSVN